MNTNEKQFLWVEKYRPNTIKQCILPEVTKKQIAEFIASGQIPNFIFYGSPGSGKTTVARAIASEMGSDLLFINASLENGIDVLRTKIQGFASTISLSSTGVKLVILDEFDYASQNIQAALRGFIEEFASNCRFIMTCNFKERIMPALHSRSVLVDFRISKTDKPKIATEFFKRAKEILNIEKISYDEKVIAELIKKHIPDWRKVLNELQRYSSSGTIDAGILVNLDTETFKSLVKALKGKQFTDVRAWVSKNSDMDSSQLFRMLYDNAVDILEPSSIPELVLILAKYQYQQAFVADHELNVMAAMTEAMMSLSFK